MSTTQVNNKFDCVFVGTSMICVLEAVYQSLCGKSVLMIDNQREMGGAWVSLDLFGLHDVENAIHYFLPDPNAFDFMKNVLRWNVVVSERKYRVFPVGRIGCWRVRYDSAIGRIASRIKEQAVYGKKRAFPLQVIKVVAGVLFESQQPSYYVEGGTPAMLEKVKAILDASSVQVRYLTDIEKIHFSTDPFEVRVSTDQGTVSTSKIVISHGSRISNITSASGPMQVVEKLHLRPAVHLLLADPSPTKMYECVFTADPIIKYAHDITRVVREAAELIGKRKLIVLALKPEVTASEGVYQAILDKLKLAGMAGPNSVIEAHQWQDVYLPRLEDSDLDQIKATFQDQVDYLKTENFSRGIGLYSRKWATKIGRAL